MNEQFKILIRCDLCDALVAPEDIKQISVGPCGYLWIEEPTMHGTHFACKYCLESIGWKEEKNRPTRPTRLTCPTRPTRPTRLTCPTRPTCPTCPTSPPNEKPADTPNAAGSSDNTSTTI